MNTTLGIDGHEVSDLSGLRNSCQVTAMKISVFLILPRWRVARASELTTITV